jgi:hypothetical protein
MNDSDRSEMDKICMQLYAAFQGVVSWEWDRRFKTVLAKFSVDIEDSVREILERCLSMTWHTGNIGQSPDTLRFVNTYLGGLWEEQFLFTSEPTLEGFVFCAWWPWRNGKTVSIRVSPFYYRLNDLQMGELTKKLKHWFGILEDKTAVTIP